MNKDQLWQAILGELELILSKANFSTWFKDTFVSEWNNERIVVGVPNTFTQSWLQNKYHAPIKAATKNIVGDGIKEIIYKVESIKNQPQTASLAEVKTEEIEITQNGHGERSLGFNKRYKFSSFVVGKNNELAHAAAQAVANKPGQTYNPLFIYGGVGLGKTHLLQAIGHYILENNPSLTVLYTTCEKFTNDYIQSIKNGQTNKFRDYYRNIDLLIIDDIHFLAGKEQTQEGFFHTFNDLHQNNKQIIISSDRPPQSIPTIEDRLKSRFSWGMIADISQPDLETRAAILQAKATEKSFNLNQDIITYIASTIQSNIRELEGALNRIIAHAELTKEEISFDAVKNILSSMTQQSKKGIITAKQIIREVSEFYDVDINDILGSSRKKELVNPRQIIMYLIREETSSSFPNIGAEVGGRDHTTVMHACKKITQDLNVNDKLSNEINSIRQRLFNQKSS
jgi:chromosomal replication initiator protein